MSAILCHTNISEVVSKYPPKPVQNLTLTPGKFLVSLTWEDPEDYTEEGYTCTWTKTIVVRKIGGYPNDIHDGTVVVTTVERDKYKTTGYEDTGLTGGETYYYRVFACSTDGVYSEPAEGTGVPKAYKIMTVKIDLNNSNPATCGSYADDAVDMESGKTDSATTMWQEFFGYKPCLFKDGKVVGYLNQNDFTKFENGTAADITSGNAGDVMIQFPRKGVRISKSGKVVTVSMTDDPNDPSFKYYAHQRGNSNKDYFYLGAYDGYIDSNLRSLSGKSPAVSGGVSTYYNYGRKNGDGYGCMGYYQWLFIQVMYVLQFKGNLDSQSTVGNGNVFGDPFNVSIKNTGRSNGNGMIYGDSDVVKLFGIEDAWGNIGQHVNNYYVNNYGHITTTTDDTITDVNKYTDRGWYSNQSSMGGTFAMDCMGTTETGFTPTFDGENYGSSSTYFCDIGAVNWTYVPYVGGIYSDYSHAGLFAFNVGYSRDVCNVDVFGSRLGYL